jgi:hypothetical protein
MMFPSAARMTARPTDNQPGGHMTKNQLVKRIKQLRKQGVSFRAIEARLTKTLGLSEPGNGTKAFRTLKAA